MYAKFKGVRLGLLTHRMKITLTIPMDSKITIFYTEDEGCKKNSKYF